MNQKVKAQILLISYLKEILSFEVELSNQDPMIITFGNDLSNHDTFYTTLIYVLEMKNDLYRVT